MRMNGKENLCQPGQQGSCGNLCCTRIENFAVSYGKKQVFYDVNLHIHCGELTALIGRNGSGKSTLLKAILGQIPHSGTLSYVDEKGLHSGRPCIGYVPQKLNFDPGTPTAVLDLFAACLSTRPAWLPASAELRQRIAADLQRVQAEALIDRPLGVLSGGELQRVLLALALDPLPDILLLDEPLSGIDQNGLEIFYEMVAALRKVNDVSIILVSHDFELVAKYADHVILLDGTIVEDGTPEEVFASARTAGVFNLFNKGRNFALTGKKG